MLRGVIPSEDLHRICYNVLHYSHKDTMAEGWTLWSRGGDQLRVTAFDDFFAISDRAEGLDHEQSQIFVMDLPTLKLLEKDLRNGTKDVDLSDLPVAEASKGSVLNDADGLCFPEGYLDPKPIDFVAFAPDRLRKLSLLKPAGYPIDMRVYWQPSDDDMDPVIAFRYGPTVRGAIAPVNRQAILKMYQGEEVWRV